MLVFQKFIYLNYSYRGAMRSPTANFPRPQKVERTSNYRSAPISPLALEMAVLKNRLGMDLMRHLTRRLMRRQMKRLIELHPQKHLMRPQMR